MMPRSQWNSKPAQCTRARTLGRQLGRWMLILAVIVPACSAQSARRPTEDETRTQRGPLGLDDLKRRIDEPVFIAPQHGRRSLETTARRGRDYRTSRRPRKTIDPRDAVVAVIPESIPSFQVPIGFFEELDDQLEPLASQLWIALLLLLVLVAWNMAFRRHPILKRRARNPRRTLGLYGVLALATLVCGFVLPNIYTTVHLLSLFVLLLAFIQILTIVTVDAIMEHVRGVRVSVILRDVSGLVLYLVIAILVLGNYGVDLTGVLTGSVVLTAVVGLAFQDTLGSIAAGLALQIERPFHEDDWVEIENLSGRVLEVNWRSTKLRTPSNEIVVIPNRQIGTVHLTNLSAPDRFHRRHVEVGLPYDAPPNRCKQVLEASARADGVLAVPKPYVTLTSFDDSSIRYTLYFYIGDHDLERHPVIEDRVRTNIWYRLRRAGLSIPFPIVDLTLHKPDPDRTERDAAEQRDAAVEALTQIPFFDPLTQSERVQLAARMELQDFGAGEVVIMQGDAGHSLFFVRTGEVEVLDERDGRKRRIAIIGPGNFFGEMSLMTGERRSASVRTLTDSRFFVIDHEAFRDVLQNHTDLHEAIAAMLAERQSMRVTLERGIDQKVRKAHLQESLLDRIRSFLGN